VTRDEGVPPEVGDWAHGLTNAQLTCRDFGHSWRPLSARYADEGTYVRGQRCTRCRTEREQTLSLGGLILGGRYTYPDGYLAPNGMGRLTSSDRGLLRVESVVRVIGGATNGDG
jgi:hypothetical protein